MPENVTVSAEDVPLAEIALSGAPARDRLLAAATALFYREGIHSVGVDRIIEVAGVTRATLYKQFSGKEQLVLAYLQREDSDLRGLFAQAGERTDDPVDMLGLVIVGIESDIRNHHTRGCPFINAAAEYPAPGPVRDLIATHRGWFRETLKRLAEASGLRDADGLAGELVLLRDAALVGGYLDGVDTVVPPFSASARTILDAHRPERAG